MRKQRAPSDAWKTLEEIATIVKRDTTSVRLNIVQTPEREARVNIRNYLEYVSGPVPTPRGVMLSLEEFEALVSHADEVRAFFASRFEAGT